MNTNDTKFKEGISNKNWFKKGHKLSPESIEKMRKSKTKYTLEQRVEKDKNRSKEPKRIAWILEHRNKPLSKYGVYKRSAHIKNILFELTFEQFMNLWQKPCSYCQESINTIGIDRLDNNIGYVVSNIISCCKVCNYMKREIPFTEFLDRCEKITKFHNKFLF